MNNNFTYVAIVIDRSGSMESIKSDIEGGLKTFAQEQRKLDGKIKVSLFDFDSEFQTIGESKDLNLLENYELVPRGMTALYDAIGRSTSRVGEILRKMPERERPGKVIFLIVTDGHENASKEYKASQVKEIIKRQEEAYNWNFVYLGANQDAIAVGDSIGVRGSNSLTYNAGAIGVKNSFRSFIGYTNSARVAKDSFEVSNLSFTDEDRDMAVKK